MNTELSGTSGLSVPEFYFRIAREEDDRREGKYFTKIERVRWQDIE